MVVLVTAGHVKLEHFDQQEALLVDTLNYCFFATLSMIC